MASRAALDLIIELHDKATADLKQVSRELRALGDTADDAGKRGGGAFKTIAVAAGGFVAANVIGGIVTQVADVASATVGLASDFESTFNTFASVAGSSITDAGMEMQDFKDLALEMGMATQFSAGQAGDALVALTKGGVDPATAAAGGLEAALGLAAAGDIALAEAADISAKQLGVWVDSSADAADKASFLADTANLMAQAANASTVDVDELAGGMAAVGGTAKVAGLSFQETTQAMAELAPGFSSASDAGTSFKTFLSRLVPTTDEQTEAMISLGLATKDGQSAFYDSSGAFIGMEQAAELLQNQTQDLSQEQRLLAFNTIFGSDAIRAAAIIAEKGGEGYDAMGEAMAGAGTAAEQAATRNKGLNFAVDSLMGSAETLGIVVGTALLPPLTSLVEDVLTPGVNVVLGFSKAILEADDPMLALVGAVDRVVPGFGLLVDGMGMVVGIIQTGAVPALAGLSAATGVYAVTQLPTLILAAGTATTAIGTMTTAIVAQGTAMAVVLGPFALVAAAVGGLVYVYQARQEKLEDLVRVENEHNDVLQAVIKTQNEFAASANGQSAAGQALGAELDLLKQKHHDIVLRIQEYKDALPMAETDAMAQALKPHNAELRELEAQMVVSTAAMYSVGTAAPAYITWMQEAGTGTSEYAAALRDVTGAAGPTTEELKEITKEIEAAASTAVESVGAIVAAEVTFHADREAAARTHEQTIGQVLRDAGVTRVQDLNAAGQEQVRVENEKHAKLLQDQAIAYAQEQAAHRQHLGEMLIAHVEGWAAMGQVSAERAADMTAQLALEYGVRQSESDKAFGQMVGHLQDWANNASISSASVIEDLAYASETAENTQRVIDQLTGEYTAKFIHDFQAGKISADELAIALSKIPSMVSTTMHHNFREAYADIQATAGALAGLPAGKIVRIEAAIDPMIERHSPAPLEEVMFAIDDFSKRPHVFNISAVGTEQIANISPMLADIIARLEAAAKDGRAGGKRIATEIVGGMNEVLPTGINQVINTGINQLIGGTGTNQLATDAGTHLGKATGKGYRDTLPSEAGLAAVAAVAAVEAKAPEAAAGGKRVGVQIADNILLGAANQLAANEKALIAAGGSLGNMAGDGVKGTLPTAAGEAALAAIAAVQDRAPEAAAGGKRLAEAIVEGMNTILPAAMNQLIVEGVNQLTETGGTIRAPEDAQPKPKEDRGGKGPAPADARERLREILDTIKALGDQVQDQSKKTAAVVTVAGWPIQDAYRDVVSGVVAAAQQGAREINASGHLPGKAIAEMGGALGNVSAQTGRVISEQGHVPIKAIVTWGGSLGNASTESARIITETGRAPIKAIDDLGGALGNVGARFENLLLNNPGGSAMKRIGDMYVTHSREATATLRAASVLDFGDAGARSAQAYIDPFFSQLPDLFQVWRQGPMWFHLRTVEGWHRMVGGESGAGFVEAIEHGWGAGPQLVLDASAILGTIDTVKGALASIPRDITVRVNSAGALPTGGSSFTPGKGWGGDLVLNRAAPRAPSVHYGGDTYVINVDARGSNLSRGQITDEVKRGLDATGQRADATNRMRRPTRVRGYGGKA